MRIRYLEFGRVWRQVLPALGTLLCLAAISLAAEEEPTLAGSYRDERITIELSQPSRLGTRTSYTGTIHLGDQQFPLKADATGGRLQGTFDSGGDQFEFSASVTSRTMTFTTEGTTYRLRKQSANPLARPSRPNPLSQPPTNITPSAPTPASPSPSPVPMSANTVRFKRYSVMDDGNMIGGEAFSLLIPVGWQVEGGVAWRMHPAMPMYVAMRVSSPDRSAVLEAFETVPFVWTEGGIPFFPPGSKYLGNEVATPIEDPVAYVRQVILPRFRQNIGLPRFIETEELPKIAEAVAQNSQEPGIQKKFRAARVRIEYQENGRAMQEDIYCVLASAYAPTLKTTYWGPERNYSFRAEKGKLDEKTRVFQTMVGSFRPNLQWFNRYVQLVQILVQNQLNAIRRVGELSRYIARTSDEINEMRRQVYERQQASQDRVNASFSQYIRGVQEYRNPFESRSVELPSGYREVWANPLGEYILSDDVNFNPNLGSNNNWQRLEQAGGME